MIRPCIAASLFTVSIAAPSSAFAADWQYLSTDKESSKYYVDLDSIRIDGSYTYVWARIDATENTEVAYFEDKQQIKLNCTTRALAVVRSVQYDADGLVMDSYSNNYAPLKAMPPGTIADDLFDAVC